MQDAVEELLKPIRDGESDTLRLPNDLHRVEKMALFEALPTLKGLKRFHMPSTVWDPGFLEDTFIDGLRKCTSLESIDIRQHQFSDQGALKFVQALADIKGLKHLFLNFTELPPPALDALADTVNTLDDLHGLHIDGNAWTQGAFDHLADALKKHHNLSALTMTAPSGAGSNAKAPKPNDSYFAETLVDAYLPNLVTMHGVFNDALRQKVDMNTNECNRAKRAIGETKEDPANPYRGKRELTPEEIFTIEGLRPALKHLAPSATGSLADYDAYLQTLPTLENNLPPTAEALFTTADEGLSPLENPLVWRNQPDLLEIIATNGTLQDRQRRTEKGTSAIEAAFAFLPTDTVLDTLHRHNIRIGLKDLLKPDGSNTPLFDIIDKKGNAGALLSQTNREGMSVREQGRLIQAVRNAKHSQTPDFATQLLSRIKTSSLPGRGR